MINSIKTHSLSHALTSLLSDLATPPLAHSLKLAHMATGDSGHNGHKPERPKPKRPQT